jgi:hypothetical protein
MKKFLLSLLVALSLATVARAEVVRLEIPGGWYGEGRLDRQYAVLVTNQFIATSAGRVELPRYVVDGREVADNVLFLRVPPTGAFAISGQSHAGLGNWEWKDGLWRISSPSFGVNPIIYDWLDRFYYAVPGGGTGSQGYRYATHTNDLVTGDATYADPARAIWEYTTYGDVTIGQGANGCIAIHGVLRYTLEPGDCRFVRYTRSADMLAVTMVKQVQGKTVLLWMNVQDLASFPPEGTIIPDPEPEPEPEPEPVSCGQIPNNGKLALEKLWARPDVNALVKSSNDDDRRKSALMFAQQLAFTVDPAWGTKNAGGGRPQSKDAVARFVDGELCGWDIVNGTTRELQFGAGEPIPGQEFIPVVAINHNGTTPEPEPEPEPDPEVAILKARIVVLERQVQELTEQNAALTAERDALQRKLDAIIIAPPPTCTTSISGPAWVRNLFGITATCEVVR